MHENLFLDSSNNQQLQLELRMKRKQREAFQERLQQDVMKGKLNTFGIFQCQKVEDESTPSVQGIALYYYSAYKLIGALGKHLLNYKTYYTGLHVYILQHSYRDACNGFSRLTGTKCWLQLHAPSLSIALN